VVNSVFGILLRPGLIIEQRERWLGILDIVEEGRGRFWTRTLAMAEFLEETERIAVSAAGRAGDDADRFSAGTDAPAAEARASDSVLAALGFARLLGMPGFLLKLPEDGWPGPFLAEDLKGSGTGESRHGLSGEKFPFPGRTGTGGGGIGHHAAVNRDSREVPGTFPGQRNASDFAVPLNSPALRLTGDEGVRAGDLEYLLKGLGEPTGVLKSPFPPVMPVEHRIIRLGEPGSPDAGGPLPAVPTETAETAGSAPAEISGAGATDGQTGQTGQTGQAGREGQEGRCGHVGGPASPSSMEDPGTCAPPASNGRLYLPSGQGVSVGRAAEPEELPNGVPNGFPEVPNWRVPFGWPVPAVPVPPRIPVFPGMGTPLEIPLPPAPLPTGDDMRECPPPIHAGTCGERRPAPQKDCPVLRSASERKIAFSHGRFASERAISLPHLPCVFLKGDPSFVLTLRLSR
jgi:hypothetical protein